ncbi:MAG: hypothetical protein P4N41_17480 [Negativicutes bacterium]|nr:hypothetical protein [Negativicutes bacterium]
MITIYHGVRPALPQAACRVRLEDGGPAGSDRNWRENPLFIAGRDSAGYTVCCLVHGRHRGLYRRALAGTAALFGLSVRWVDTDALLWQEMGQNFFRFITLLLYNYFPGLQTGWVERSVDRWIGLRVLTEREERR